MSHNLCRKTDSRLRIGAGAGFAGDRLEPAGELVSRGDLDVLGFELLAERTIALAQRRRRSGGGPGFDERLAERMKAVLPEALSRRTLVITNGGAADRWPPVSERIDLDTCSVLVGYFEFEVNGLRH